MDEVFFYDFHIHTSRSFRCSKELTDQKIDIELSKNNIELVVCDFLTTKRKEGIGIQEVIDNNGVHHLILSDVSRRKELEEILSFSPKTKTQGRPYLDMDHEELGRRLNKSAFIYGAAHAFSPKTGLFKLGNISSHYRPYFIEIGLDLRPDEIPVLKIPYFSFSDAHSLEKIGRSYVSYNKPLKLIIEDLFNNQINRENLKLYCCPKGYGKYSVEGCYKCNKKKEDCTCKKPRISDSSYSTIRNIPKKWIDKNGRSYSYQISSYFDSEEYIPGYANKYGKKEK